MSAVTYSLRIEEEEIPVQGNALASGDEAADRECEQEILSRLDRGDLWAWCTVIVTAELDGFTGNAILGGCSYRDEADFCEPGGYYQDMRGEALNALREDIEGAIKRGEAARDTLAKLENL